jgi:hypothetical protein
VYFDFVGAAGRGCCDKAEMEVTATFKTMVESAGKKSSQSWTFERRTNQVIHVRGERIDRWTRVGPAEITLEQIYPEEKIVLEFNQGDLKASGATNQWSSYFHLVDTNMFGKLKSAGEKKRFGKRCHVYRGILDGAKWDVVWIPELGIPASIVRTQKGSKMKTELTRIGVPASEIDESGLQRVDFADVGDMENNERLQALLKRERHEGHRHHDH